MEPKITLVLASTFRLDSPVAETALASLPFFTFHISYETSGVCRRLFSMKPKVIQGFVSGTSRFSLAQEIIRTLDPPTECYEAIMAALEPHVIVAKATFRAINNGGKISTDTMKGAASLWGVRINDVLKSVKQGGERHEPRWKGALLGKHVAEATPVGWRLVNTL